MATLTPAQTAMYARAAGFSGNTLTVMVAIAGGESSYRTHIVNSTGHTGLWQISPVHRKAHPTWTQSWLKDPGNNARAAKAIYDEQGLDAWEAYTNGAYKKYMDRAVEATGAPQGIWDDIKRGFDVGPGPEDLWDGGTGNDPSLDTEGISRTADVVARAGNWVSNPRNLLRVVYVTTGGLIVLVGLAVMARPITGAVGALPQARAIKGAVKKVGKGKS